MPNSSVSAQTVSLATAAQDVLSVRDTLVSIKNQVDGVLQSSQSGYNTPSAPKFYQTMNEWNTDFQTVLNNLQNISDALGGTSQTYEATMDNEMSSMNMISSQINPM